MADHVRKQIRDEAAAILRGLVRTGDRVWSGRISPLTAAELPGLTIVAYDEDSEDGAMNAGPTAQRALRLIVQAWAQGSDELLDTLDAIAADIETALFAPATENISGLAMMMAPPTTQIELLEPPQGASRRTGVVRLLFPVTYRTRLSDPTTQV